jgi:hypothetical protein
MREVSCREAVYVTRGGLQRFGKHGHLTDKVTKDYIRKLLQNLVEWTQRTQ